MSTWTSSETGATITGERARRVTETVRLEAAETVEELRLHDLRDLVERTAYLPGDAQVELRPYGINIVYIAEDDDAVTELDIALAQQRTGGVA